MPHALLRSPSASSRLAAARSWLLDRPASQEVLVVTPTAEAGQDLLCQAALERGAAFGWRRMTFRRLAADLATPTLVREGLAPIGPKVAEAVMARAVHRLSGRDRLGRYASIGHTPGFAGAASRALTEAALAGVETSRLEQVAVELRELAETFDAEMRAAHLADYPRVLQLALAAVKSDGFEHPLLGQPLLLLDLPVESRLEAQLLAEAASRTDELLATLPLGDRRSERHLQDALQLAPVDLPSNEDADGPQPDGCLSRLQRHLFADSTPGPQGEDDSLAILSAPGESRECVEIARRILRCAESGQRFDRIAVLLRSPEDYRAHLEEAFQRANIPAHYSRGVLRPDPAGRAMLALLRCAAEGLSARRFAEYLSLAEVPDADASGQPPPSGPAADRWVRPDESLLPETVADDMAAALPQDDADRPADDLSRPVVGGTLRAPRRWEKLLVDAAVIGGLDRWRRRLDGLGRQLEMDLEALEDPDDPLADYFQRQLDDLQALQEYALPLLAELTELPQEAVWEQWLDRLSGLAERALRRPERVLSVFAELAPMAPIGPVDLSEVIRVLRGQLQELRVAPTESRGGRVFVGSLDAARGLQFDVVFCPGAAERLLPRKITEDPILLDSVRESLDDALAVNDDRIEAERLALRLGVGAARQQLVLSYPRLDVDMGRPRVPSFYALEAVRAAQGTLPLFSELARRAETVTATRVGWPAPTDPREAIDEAEYDLALLEGLNGLDPARTQGTAHYLLTSNAHLARALRFRARRWLHGWNAADGLVLKQGEQAEAWEALSEHLPDRRSFSPTALQNYAACPYRFYLYTILRLGEREEAESIEEMDALQRGSLVHDTQFELLTRLQGEGLLPVVPAGLEKARQALDEVLDQVAEQYRDDLAPAIDRVWDDGIASIRADLREWLRRMSEDDSGFVPWRFELSFGLADRRQQDSHSVVEAVPLDCGIRLRGSIDLIERKAPDLVRVTDHKTGKQWFKQGDVVAGGKSLQPVFYSLAAEKLLSDQRILAGRLYYCTVRGEFGESEVALDDDARRAAETVAETIGRALESGFLPAAPDEGACQWCSYLPVCGSHEELRSGRKHAGRTAPLVQLRKLS